MNFFMVTAKCHPSILTSLWCVIFYKELQIVYQISAAHVFT